MEGRGHVSDLLERVAGAPITWGVDGSPGWGYLMDRDRVHAGDGRERPVARPSSGPTAICRPIRPSFGSYLARFDLSIVGGFVPALLYRPDRIDDATRLREARRAAARVDWLEGARPRAIVDDHPGYDIAGRHVRRRVDDVPGQPARASKSVVTDAGLQTALHPHWGMAIETGPRHRPAARLVVGRAVPRHRSRLPRPATDPVDVARAAGGRVLHVHLKDVDPAAAERVRSGEVPFRQAVIDGLFVPARPGRRRHRRRHRGTRGGRLSRLVRPRAGRLAAGGTAGRQRPQGRCGRQRRVPARAGRRSNCVSDDVGRPSDRRRASPGARAARGVPALEPGGGPPLLGRHRRPGGPSLRPRDAALDEHRSARRDGPARWH